MHGSAPAKQELQANREVIERDRENAGDAKRIVRILLLLFIRGSQTAAAADEAVARAATNAAVSVYSCNLEIFPSVSVKAMAQSHS